MQSNYARMYELIRPLFRVGEPFTKTMLWHRLSAYYLLEEFNNIYREDCHCSGKWSFWDFSDRFQRFAQALCTENFIMRVDRGKYQILRY